MVFEPLHMAHKSHETCDMHRPYSMRTKVNAVCQNLHSVRIGACLGEQTAGVHSTLEYCALFDQSQREYLVVGEKAGDSCILDLRRQHNHVVNAIHGKSGCHLSLGVKGGRDTGALSGENRGTNVHTPALASEIHSWCGMTFGKAWLLVAMKFSRSRPSGNHTDVYVHSKSLGVRIVVGVT